MSNLLNSNIANWLRIKPSNEDGLYEVEFAEQHLGNIFIRSIHGGVSGAAIEFAAEAETRKALADDTARLAIVSNSIDYLRITRDVNIKARAKIVRLSRRLSVVDVVCWQDDEAIPVARGTVTLKIDP